MRECLCRDMTKPDFDTPTFEEPLTISFSLVEVSAMPAYLGNEAKTNQSISTIEQNDNRVVISNNGDEWLEYTKEEVSGKWIALDINIGIKNLLAVKLNGEYLTQADIDTAAEFNLAEGHLLYWVNASSTFPLVLTFGRDKALNTDIVINI